MCVCCSFCRTENKNNIHHITSNQSLFFFFFYHHALAVTIRTSLLNFKFKLSFRKFVHTYASTHARTHVHMLIEWDFVDPGAHAGGWTSKRALLFLFCFSLGRMAAVFLVLLVIKGERCLLKFFLSFFLLLELCFVQPAVVVVVVVVRLIVGCPCVYNYQRTHVCYVSRITTSLPLPCGGGGCCVGRRKGWMPWHGSALFTGSWRRNQPDRGTSYSTEQQPVGYC